jgi:hypothetical protein
LCRMMPGRTALHLCSPTTSTSGRQWHIFAAAATAWGGGGVSDGHKSEATEPSMHIGGSERVAYTTLGSELSEFWNGEGYLSTSRACCHLIRHSSIIIKTFAVEAEFVENSLRNKLAIIMQF